MQGCLLVDSHKSTVSGPVRSPASRPSKKPKKHDQKQKRKPKTTQQKPKNTQPKPNPNTNNKEKWDRNQHGNQVFNSLEPHAHGEAQVDDF